MPGVIICTRGRRTKLCGVCLKNAATKLCDGTLRPGRASTCDEPLCMRCAATKPDPKNKRDTVDFCPTCANLQGATNG